MGKLIKTESRFLQRLGKKWKVTAKKGFGGVNKKVHELDTGDGCTIL